jgi:leucine dehydrogenase
MTTPILSDVLPFSPPTGAEQPLTGVFEHAAFYGVEELHFKYDKVTGLKAIVAIHDTSRGPSLGGTRCLPYKTENQAINDAVRLAAAMSYKSAFADLPFGGGKAVIIRPRYIEDPEAFFETYGDFVNSLNGRYVTAVDVGTGVEAMDIIARKTPYVLSTSEGSGDPSQYTAQGVVEGIRAAASMHLNRADLQGLRVVIQGVGKVGCHLANLLHEQGASLIVCDSNEQAVLRCAHEFGAARVAPQHVFDVECDVFSPCALGGVINSQTVKRIKASIVCGAANNQLATPSDGDALARKHIFFVPDYVANTGGLIHVVCGSTPETQSRIAAIYDAVVDIYRKAQAANQASHTIADRIAEGILARARHSRNTRNHRPGVY